MVMQMVTLGNAFCKSTRDTKSPNSQLWMNLSNHSYILTMQNIKNEFLKYR